MKATFIHDARYMEKNGEIYTELEFSYDSWAQYLKYFDHLTVIGRSYKPDNDVYKNAETYNTCSGKDVDFQLFPSLTSLKKIIFQRRRIKREIEATIKTTDAVILRGVQENVWLAFLAARKHGKPIILEGTGCMWNNTWHYGSILGKLYAPLRYLRARRVFKHSDAVLYVTSQFLQSRYPTNGLSDHASDVQIDPPNADILQSRLDRITASPETTPLKIGIIGPVHHTHKGIDTAITALAQWHKTTKRGFKLHILGRGNPQTVQGLADGLNIGSHMSFDGLRPADQVKDWLDDLNLYLQPSRTEGLPRATLEAMSRALPVIVSDAGDMPSLIDPHYVHRRGQAEDLQTKIENMAADHTTMTEQAEKNFKKIEAEYHPNTLKTRREAFWDQFIEIVKTRTL
jgi:glycosyltransferase involved in cell wall biosynthesis